MVEVPGTTDEADPAFVTAALSEGGVLSSGTRVAEVEHEAIGEGVGIVGQLARLQLRYHGQAAGAPGTVILKIPSQYPQNRAIGDHYNFYEREGRFYEQLADKVPLRIPQCYWNHIDPEAGSFGMLLEDLGDRTMISQIAGVSGTRAAEAVRALGRLHGAWWSSPSLESLGWMPRLDDPINLAAGEQYRNAWLLFVERIGAAIPPEAIRVGERVQHVFEDLLRTGIGEAPITVCHGDFRADNLMFDDQSAGDDAVAVLDWQITYRGPAITDVAYFLCQSLTIEERRAREEALVRTWYDEVVATALRETGTALDGYPFEVAWAQYRRAVLGTTVYPVTALGTMDLANERGRELVEAMTVRSFMAALDLESEAFLD